MNQTICSEYLHMNFAYIFNLKLSLRTIFRKYQKLYNIMATNAIHAYA